MYVQNLGAGQVRLPGRVAGLQGSVMYTVKLEDGKIVHKHSDHLQVRTCNTENETNSVEGEIPDDDISTIINSEEVPTNPMEVPPRTTPTAPPILSKTLRKQWKGRSSSLSLQKQEQY